MGTEYSPDALVSAVRGLQGARLAEVDRLLDMVRVGLTRDTDEVRLHVHCPFRLIKGDRILLGSADMRYPLDRGGDRDGAFQQYATQFDRSARMATSLLGERVYPILRAELRPGGALFLEAPDDLRVEMFPDVSGPIECWRLFVKGVDEHVVYRARAGRARED